MKKASKFVASLLAGSMVLSMAACGNDSGNTDQQSSTPQQSTTESTPAAGNDESTPAESSQPEQEPAAEVAKPDKIKIMIDGTVPTQENYGDDFWAKYTELTGVEVEIIQPDHDA